MTPIDKRARVLAEHLAVAARGGIKFDVIFMSEKDGVARLQFATVDDLVAWASLFGIAVRNEVNANDPSHYMAIGEAEIVEGCPIRGTWFGKVAAPRLTLVGAS